MDNQKIWNALDTYYQICSLKQKERQGWIYWNVSGTRIESIAEHVFGVEQLAWIMYSETGIELDIFKVIAMLSVHETEEVIIKDITPFDGVTPEEKSQMGEEAVNQVLKNLSNHNIVLDLIHEFNEGKTKEAQFAYLCDKMECDLQAKKYSDEGNCKIEEVEEKIIQDKRVKEIIENGATTVADIFVEYDKGKYVGTVFEDMIHFLKNTLKS